MHLEKRARLGPSATSTTIGPSASPRPSNAYVQASDLNAKGPLIEGGAVWMAIETIRPQYSTESMTTTSRPVHTQGIWWTGAILFSQLAPAGGTPTVAIAAAATTTRTTLGPSASASARARARAVLQARSHGAALVAQKVIQPIPRCSSDERSCAFGSFGTSVSLYLQSIHTSIRDLWPLRMLL